MLVQKPPKHISFPQIESEMLQKWEEEGSFVKSIKNRQGAPKFKFYDGPPFATGLPHLGHFVPSSIKDAFPRFFTMKGFQVERRFGWDCHGVPVEMLVQKELGLKGRADIESFGIAKFNEACKESVLRYTSQWRDYMKKLGRWVDMTNEYRTMDLDFMESVWSVVQTLWQKGLVYEGLQVGSYSSALGSSLSNFEASMDYRDIQDPSLTLKAFLDGKFKGSALLVWTTTPWTMPVNVAIAVDPKGNYVHLEQLATGEKYILLAELVSSYFPKVEDYKVLETFLGSQLEGIGYKPFFESFSDRWNKNCFKVYGTNYVLHDTGTGAVHTAPCFGEDDFQCAKRYDLPLIDHLDANGNLLEGNPSATAGLFFKDADKLLIQILKKNGFVFKHDTFTHAYPMCYRSGTPLMYRALPGWFVKVTELKEKLIQNNQKINWIPEHIRDGRFGKWLENARDWNISRSRFWGNPIPIWKNEEGESLCLGSIAELQAYTNEPITDLHMDAIDHITIPSPTGKSPLKRVPFVLDCWFESGSMPYAQAHYPFENKSQFDTLFPADFICEGLDQTRGWFYSLNVLSTALFDKPAFLNCVVNGLVLAEDGRKMSKSLKNFPDPMLTIDEFGADSIRLFLLNSPATTADEVRFSLESVKENTRRILLPLWNAYSFFSTYAHLDGFDTVKHGVESVSKNELDGWIQISLNKLILTVDKSMSTYQIAKAVPAISDFLEDLNNWYIRRSRRRFWDGDKEAFTTLHGVLVTLCKILAPFAPFSAEYFYQKLTQDGNEVQTASSTDSVHLSSFPEAREVTLLEKQLLAKVTLTRRVVELGRNIRTVHKIKNRQPLRSITIGLLDAEQKEHLVSMEKVLKDELNVKNVKVTLQPQTLAKIFIKPNFKVLGKSLGDAIKTLQTDLLSIPQDLALQALRGEDIVLSGKTLTPNMLVVELRSAGTDLVASDAEIVVALDAEIDEDLRKEGVARELVSHIQKSRKVLNFEVEERLDLHLDLPAAFHAALESNRQYIEEETLCQLIPSPKSHSLKNQVEIEGGVAIVSLARR